MLEMEEPKENNREPFNVWYSEVDKKIQSVCGLGIRDLPDQPYYDWYENGMTTHEAKEITLENVGFYPQG